MIASGTTSIWFPNLGVELKNVGSSFHIFGFEIAYYAVVVAIGMGIGFLITEWMAKRTKQNIDLYLDFALYAIIISILGARLYYVAFAWDEFKLDPIQVLNIRNGGLAIYGGIIAAVITALCYTKVKKYSFGLLVDTGSIGLVTGQIIGRWGNFFNREAFGKYTNSKFAMLLDLNDVSGDYTNSLVYVASKYKGKEEAFRNILEIRNNIVIMDGIEYISVHPTFLYESLWNTVILILLIIYTKRKKFHGEVFLLYMFGYGLGRIWIEGLRTDSLFLWNSPIEVSQLLSILLVLLSLIIILVKRQMIKKVK